MGRKVGRRQKRMCTDTKSDTKSRQTPSLSQGDTKSTPKRKKMENFGEEKRNKEGHKRATT